MQSITPQPSYADRLALAVCEFSCPVACPICRTRSASVTREAAKILRERHGSSATADWLDGVGCHHQQEGA